MTTKQDVMDALSALRINRSPHLADRHIRTLLGVYGNGALSAASLAPEFYDSVFVAAGGRGDAVAPIKSERRRPNSPLVADLERRMRERAGKPRQVPTARVDFGNPSEAGERRD